MPSVYKAGMKVIFECQEALRKLNALDEVAAQAEAYTIKDLKGRVPGMVSKAVAKVYNISASEVAQAQRTKARLTDKQFTKANKAHMRTSFRGDSLSSMEVVFTGRKHANWNTKAKPMPAPRGNKVFSTAKKYAVTQTVYRGKPVTIHPQGGNRVFVMRRKGKLIPMVVGKSNQPRVKASTSVPQTVMNEQVVDIWKPELNDYIHKHFTKHLKRFSDKL